MWWNIDLLIAAVEPKCHLRLAGLDGRARRAGAVVIVAADIGDGATSSVLERIVSNELGREIRRTAGFTAGDQTGDQERAHSLSYRDYFAARPIGQLTPVPPRPQ